MHSFPEKGLQSSNRDQKQRCLRSSILQDMPPLFIPTPLEPGVASHRRSQLQCYPSKLPTASTARGIALRTKGCIAERSRRASSDEQEEGLAAAARRPRSSAWARSTFRIEGVNWIRVWERRRIERIVEEVNVSSNLYVLGAREGWNGGDRREMGRGKKNVWCHPSISCHQGRLVKVTENPSYVQADRCQLQ